MGTVVSIHVADVGLGESHVHAAVARAVAEMHRHDELFSLWDTTSVMSRVRRGEIDIGAAPNEIGDILALCRTACALSGGWFDAFAMPGGVDPTGIVKGWSAARALEVLESEGVGAAMVNAGGDVACCGSPDGALGETAWHVGIRHPWKADSLACVVAVGAAVATSGEYERGPHLFDPIGRRGPSPASATVIGPDLWLADALATAVAVGGDEAFTVVTALDGYDAYLIRSDATETWSSGVVFVDA